MAPHSEYDRLIFAAAAMRAFATITVATCSSDHRRRRRRRLLLLFISVGSRGIVSRDRDDHALHRQSQDASMSIGAEADSVLGIVRICSGLAYDSLKTRLVSYHCTRMGFAECLNNSRSQSPTPLLYRQIAWLGIRTFRTVTPSSLGLPLRSV